MGDDDNGTIERLPTPEIQPVDSKSGEGLSGKGMGKGEEGIELGVLSKFENDVSKQVQVGKQIALADMLNPEKKYMSGWRLYCLTFGLCTSLLLSTLETTIVSTSLVSITNALQGFENRDWVVTSYLLTYTGFLVIFAKFSDIFGAKFMLLLALLIFTVFSIACGSATAMTELIILRSLQGVGGSGIYSLVGVVAMNVIHPLKSAKYMAIISSVMAISSILGPLLGGVINQQSTWRWVFLLNAPAGAAATALIVFFLPSDFFPLEPGAHPSNLLKRFRARFTITAFRRLDLIGVVLMLAASILLVFALEEAVTRYAWGSVPIIVTLVVAVGCWVGFVGWEIGLERWKGWKAEPIFPMRLLKDRILVGMLLNAFFTGFPFTSLVVNIPQRFQAVSLSTPTHAGISLLPILLIAPFASGLSGLLAGKLRVPPFYLIITGSILQLLGVGLATTLSSTDLEIQPKLYGFEVLMGLGFGFVLTPLLALIPMVVAKADMPVMIGAVTQVRVLGGTIGLAISTVVLNSYVKTALLAELSIQEVAALSQSLSALGSLSEAQQLFMRRVFAEGYNRQTRITAVFSGMVVLTSFLMWERKPRGLKSAEEGVATVAVVDEAEAKERERTQGEA